MSKDTLVGAQVVMPALHLGQIEPRDMHKIITRELAQKLAYGVQDKIAESYFVKEHGVGVRYPAFTSYTYTRDATAYGIELHIMSGAELKEAIDAATEELRKKHAESVTNLAASFKASVTAEAKRLLEQAAK